MRAKLSQDDFRWRIHRAAEVLRQFGLVDTSGLSTALRGRNLPSQKDLSKLLRKASKPLPRGLDEDYVAACLLHALGERAPQVQAWLTAHASLKCNLADIPPGDEHFKDYEDHAYQLLEAVFEGFLDQGEKQESMDEGRKKVDIVFRNAAQDGFFALVRDERHVPCPYVFFECKNYTGDPGNPEFDQLSGRLNRTRGRLGFLVARSYSDSERVLRHCKDRLQEDKYLLTLDDADLEALFRFRSEGALADLDALLERKLRDLLLNK